MERRIVLTIDAGKTHCDNCQFKRRFNTGLIGEWHMHCDIFGTNGEWREQNMKRPKVCLRAEKEAAK